VPKGYDRELAPRWPLGGAAEWNRGARGTSEGAAEPHDADKSGMEFGARRPGNSTGAHPMFMITRGWRGARGPGGQALRQRLCSPSVGQRQAHLELSGEERGHPRVQRPCLMENTHLKRTLQAAATVSPTSSGKTDPPMLKVARSGFASWRRARSTYPDYGRHNRHREELIAKATPKIELATPVTYAFVAVNSGSLAHGIFLNPPFGSDTFGEHSPSRHSKIRRARRSKIAQKAPFSFLDEVGHHWTRTSGQKLCRVMQEKEFHRPLAPIKSFKFDVVFWFINSWPLRTQTSERWSRREEIPPKDL